VVAAGAIAFLINLQMGAAIDNQNERNQYLNDEIAKLDKQITEILALEQQKQRLRARIQVIEQLERSRPEIVHVFDSWCARFPTASPDLAQADRPQAAAERPGAVEHARRLLHAQHRSSEWLTDPSLDILETKGAGDGGSDFTLNATQENPSLANANAADQQVASAPKGPSRSAPMSFIDQVRELDPNDPGRWPMPFRFGAIGLIFVLGVVLLGYFLAWKPKKPELDAARAQERSCWPRSKPRRARPRTSTPTRRSWRRWNSRSARCCASCRTRPKCRAADRHSQQGTAPAWTRSCSSRTRRTSRISTPSCRSRCASPAASIDRCVRQRHRGLPRIVTLHDVEITQVGKNPGSDQLQLDVTAKTYRYLDEEEQAANQPQQGPAGAKRPGT
jgi:Tfp pilus assembly protein PilO